MGPSHHAALLSTTAVGGDCTIGASVTLVALADLLLWGILALVGQVVGVRVLRRDLFDTVTELCCIDTQHRFIDLILEHIASIFLVHKFAHSWRPEALVAECGIL